MISGTPFAGAIVFLPYSHRYVSSQARRLTVGSDQIPPSGVCKRVILYFSISCHSLQRASRGVRLIKRAKLEQRFALLLSARIMKSSQFILSKCPYFRFQRHSSVFFYPRRLARVSAVTIPTREARPTLTAVESNAFLATL